MKKLFLTMMLAFVCLGADAMAQYVPVIRHIPWNGTWLGWGWYPLVNGYWPWYPGYPAGAPFWSPYGYSYYGYYGYMPRYVTYGAISWSPMTDRVGLAWGQPSLASAAAASQAYCRAVDCSPVVWAQGGCAAIARGSNMGQVSFGYHPARIGARDQALHACRAAGGLDCRIGAWVCSY